MSDQPPVTWSEFWSDDQQVQAEAEADKERQLLLAEDLESRTAQMAADGNKEFRKITLASQKRDWRIAEYANDLAIQDGRTGANQRDVRAAEKAIYQREAQGSYATKVGGGLITTGGSAFLAVLLANFPGVALILCGAVIVAGFVVLTTARTKDPR